MLPELSIVQFLYVACAAALVGFTKTSVGGVGILAVLLVALAFPDKTSPGVLLPMLIIADIAAVIYYRRDCQWKIIARLMPLTFIGIVAGYLIVDLLPAETFRKIIGIIILAMLVVSLIIEKQKFNPSKGWLFTAFAGAMAGAASMVANAAGPVFGIYLLQMGLKKQQFVDTRSWFFLIINLVKLPFSFHLGLIYSQSLTLNTVLIPVILLGAFIGIKVLKIINLKLFKRLIFLAALIAAVRLIIY